MQRRGALFDTAMEQNAHMSLGAHSERWRLLKNFERAVNALEQAYERWAQPVARPVCAHLEPGALVRSARPHPARLCDMHIRQDIETLMWQRRKWRKDLSHDGAMRSAPGEPRHYYCRVQSRHYWDAGNFVYARALQAALLYSSTEPLAGNDKTLGEFVECILALAWRRPNCDWCFRRRKLMEDMVRATVELAHDLPWVAFDGGSAQWAFDVDELRIEYCRAG